MTTSLKTQRRLCLAVFVGAWIGATVLSVVFEQTGSRSDDALTADLPDFSVYQDVSTRKARFFEFLRPLAEAENALIQQEREQLQTLHRKLRAGETLASTEQAWLQGLASRYGLQWDEQPPLETSRKLLTRVDTIPVPLALVQAAKESAWGRSRFARQANNLFGEWCYTEGCGIVPALRGPNKRHEVRAFDNVREAMASYMHNLNSHPRYKLLRQLRAELREKGEPVTARALTPGLLYYSERREAYVEEVQAMIRQYHRFMAQWQEG